MRARFLILTLFFSIRIAFADDMIDRTGKWDVDGPLGSPSSVLEFATNEGTWMNLDVHPAGDLIIFDLLGDLYLLPMSGGDATRLTHGAAYDFQPRFSPTGDQILFTSDRGGINSVWIADFDDSALSEFRNLNEDSKQTFGGANWMPDGDWIMARKRVTDVSSIGIAELWMLHKDGGSGIKLIANKAEVDSFHASADGRYIYYGEGGPFSYGRNPYGPIWSINRYDRQTGEKRPVTGGNGSAASPVLSPDGKKIAFVRRVGGASTLWLHKLADGSELQLWDGLDRDQIEAFGTHHIYPNYEWTPDGENLVVWAGGRIHRVPANGDAVEEIPFNANVALRYHEPLRSKRDPATDSIKSKLIRWPAISPDGESMVFSALGHLYWMTLPDGEPQRVTDMTEFEFAPSFSPDGRSVLFTSWSDTNGGRLHSVSWRRGGPGIPGTLYSSRSQLVNPTFSPDGEKILVVAGSGASLRGDDLGAEQRHDILLLGADGRGGASVVVSTANRGSNRRVTRPTFSADGERIWFFDDEGGGGERGERVPPATALNSVRLDGTDKKMHLKFRYAQEAIVSPDESLVAVSELHNAYVTALPKTGEPVDFDPNSATLAFQQLTQIGGEWVTWGADGQFLSWNFGNEVTRLPVDEIRLTGKAEPLDSGDDGVLVLNVTIDGNGRYAFADAIVDLDGLRQAAESAWSNAAHVRIDTSINEETPLAAWNALETWAGEAKVGIKMIKPETGDEDTDEKAESSRQTFLVDLEVPRAKPSGTVALTGARIITMAGDQVIDNGTIVVTGNRIVAVGKSDEVDVPAGADRFDVRGKTIMPGFIDVHAHLGYGVLDVNPQKEWRYYANLAYGVTTTHDPSASTHTVFSQSEMIDAGVMVGPRVFSTGFILYGATNSDMAVISSYADALSHVRRLKSLGAFSVKSYMQPRREQRQWIIRAAAAEGMLVVPEGGGDFPANMGMLMDGHSGIEHSLSVGQIYQDVVNLFAETRAGYTATLLVAYGGQEGEKYFYQHDDVWKNEKLQSFFPPREIDARSRRRIMSADDDYNHMLVAEGLKKISAAGGLVNLGAHGQLQGLGAHWELWAIASGGMAPHDALRAATINGAEYLGMEADLGSIEAGKLADLVVLDRDPLEQIRNSDSVSMTIINGVVYDANSMNQLWPQQVERGSFHFQQ